MSRFAKYLVVAILGLPCSGHASEAPQVGGSSSEADNIANAIVVCRANPKVQGCDPVLAFAAAVDQVNASVGLPGAKDAAAVAKDTTSTAAGNGRILPESSGGTSDSSGGKKSSVAFSASTDTKNANIVWTIPLQTVGNRNNSLAVSFQTPVNQDQDFENFATLDGLEKATSIGLKYYLLDARQGPFVFSINAKYGAEKHVYYSSIDLAKSTVTKHPFQAGAALEFLIKDSASSTSDRIQYNSSFGISYNYQESFTDGGEVGQTQILCPSVTSGFSKCVSGFIDAPDKDHKDLFTFDYKMVGKSFAIDPAITYDAHSHEYGIQIPIYLLPNSSKFFTGGIRYDWNSEKHESVVGVFVSSPLCIIPGNTKCSGG